MDLLATVRKEGARGGRGDFKWSDVQSSTHRENYLGHSLMAPVGRWQKGRDLNWYAKGDAEGKDGEDPAAKAERERKEEIKRIKEAEQDALAKALGFEVTPRNPNMEALGDKKEVDRILKEAAEENAEEGEKGVGFGTYGGRIGPKREDSEERIEGTAPEKRPVEPLDKHRKSRRRDDSHGRRRRSRSRSRDGARDPDRRRRRHDHRDHDGRRRSRSGERRRRKHSRSRSRNRDRKPPAGDKADYSSGNYRRDRSRSPYYREGDRREHDRYSRHERMR